MSKPNFMPLSPVQRPCPTCAHSPLREFYLMQGVPTNSCILLESKADALRYPLGDLLLAHCSECGFVTNLRFSPQHVEYSPRYEETQSFSGTFNAFARRLAEDLVERLGVRGQRVVEIGCGKGEFLALLCELGDNEGLGIDPGCRPERHAQSALGDRLRFERALYQPGQLDERADLVVSRHVLEHVPDPLAFLRSIRSEMGAHARLLIEVPDVLRVLEEGAFWDLYHEHCSYFSGGSLARTLELAGFFVEDLWIDFGDQYLLALARPARPGEARAELDLARDQGRYADALRGFGRRCTAQLSRWSNELTGAARRGEDVVLWGSGSKAVSFLSTLGREALAVRGVVDINPHRQGRYLPSLARKVLAPEELRRVAPSRVIAMNPLYRDEIAADLERLGIAAELLTL